MSHEKNFRQSMVSLGAFVDSMMNCDLDTPENDVSSTNETSKSSMMTCVPYVCTCVRLCGCGDGLGEGWDMCGGDSS